MYLCLQSGERHFGKIVCLLEKRQNQGKTETLQQGKGKTIKTGISFSQNRKELKTSTVKYFRASERKNIFSTCAIGTKKLAPKAQVNSLAAHAAVLQNTVCHRRADLTKLHCKIPL